MADPESVEWPNDIVDEVFAESDPFRLAIRGMVILEEIVDDAIDDAFRTGLPAELSRLRWPSRVSLAVALELITRELGDALVELAKIRNAFAHSIIDDVSEAQISALRPHVERLVPDTYDWDKDSPFDLFYASMLVVYNALLETIERAERLRESSEAALADIKAIVWEEASKMAVRYMEEKGRPESA